MIMRNGWVECGAAVLLLVSLTGCGDCEGASEDADAFVKDPANQQCETNSDCVVESSHCSEMKTAYCGQIAMSSEAAASEEWAGIKDGLDACDDSCSVCLALLLPVCDDGVCAKY